jgi:hypothetical protein
VACAQGVGAATREQGGRRPLTRSGIYYLPPVNRRTSTATLPARAGLLHVVATLR